MHQTRKAYTSPFDEMPISEQISEICYKRLVELAKVAYMAVNRANPLEERKESLKVEARYAEAHRQVKQHLNFYKTTIRNDIVPLAKITRHKSEYDWSQDQSTKDFRKLVSGQFTMLRERLKDYAELLMPAPDVPAFLSSLEKVYAREHDLLMNGRPGEGLAYYEFAPRYVESDF
jgi:hypothetical protein